MGGGRDKDYGYLGFSHWAEDDKKIMNQFENLKIYHPNSDADLTSAFFEIINNEHPTYLNLKK